MNVEALETIWRTSHVLDSAKPYLVTSEEFLEFLNDAECEAARRAHLLVDSRGDLSSIDITAGDYVVELDPRIITTRRIRLTSNGFPLRRMSIRDMDEECPNWEAATPSTPRVFIPDYETNTVALWPPTNVDDTMRMTVVREPIDEMATSTDEPEIAPRYQRSLLHWCSHRAYLKPDPDLLDPKAAEKALALFEAEFGPPSAAINEQWNREQNFDNGDFQ
jgi:hypothetical protein